MPDPRTSPARRTEDVVCPFCGLGCDDLTVETEGEAVRALPPACPRAIELFRRDGAPDATPRISGEAVGLEAAVGRAAELLRESRATLLAGLATDVAGMRAMVGLGEENGGVFDHHASRGLFRNLATSQRAGWLTTTVAELRNRCDLLLVVGPDPTRSFYRLFERILPPGPALQEGGSREVVFLGAAPGETASRQLEAQTVTTYEAGEGDLVHRLMELRSLLSAGEEGGRGPLAGLADKLRNARYAVVTLDAAALAHETADLMVEAVVGLVDVLNTTTRAAYFPLGGADNVIGANQVLLWRVGFPLRTAIRGGKAEHDPFLFSAEQAARDSDLTIWISAFRPTPPPATAGAMVALAHPDTVFETPPDVFIPVGTPGIDHGGQVFRLDTIVTLPLEPLRQTELPGVSEVVAAIAAEVRR